MMTTYEESLTNVVEEFPEVQEIVELLQGIQPDERVLIFSHDDPDGLGAAGILHRYLERRGIECYVEFPHRFDLTPDEVRDVIDREGEFDYLFITDKGTFSQYNDLREVMKPVVVVDHHPSDDYPDECYTYNPADATCGGHQMHQIISIADPDGIDSFDDFLALLSLRSDWTIQPLRGVIPDFVKPFYEKIKQQWPDWIEPIESRPTWMEIDQRDETLLINQVSELYFALTGGGFQYFYNDRIPALENRDQTKFGYDVLMEYGGDGFDASSVGTLDEFISALPESDTVQAVFDEYLNDWKEGMERLDKTILLDEIGPVDFHLYTGEDTPLMPMVGSVKLGKLAEKNEQGKAAIIMLNWKPGQGDDVNVHVSFRSTGGGTHMGNIASELADRVVERYGDPGKNTGGGHPPAAELTLRTDGIRPLGPLRLLMSQLDELKEFAESDNRGELSEDERERAVKLGLKYLEEEDEATVH
ncbi:MAG: DHH family phosphoesterase [bacterium]